MELPYTGVELKTLYVTGGYSPILGFWATEGGVRAALSKVLTLISRILFASPLTAARQVRARGIEFGRNSDGTYVQPREPGRPRRSAGRSARRFRATDG